MKTGRSYKYWVVLFAAVFFSLQVGAQIHAAESHDTAQHHDCAACIVASAASHQIAILPAEPEIPGLAVIVSEPLYGEPISFVDYNAPPGRAPPPRSPPALNI